MVGPDQADLVQAVLGESQFSSTFSSQRLSIIHPAYRCVDSSDRWQWLQLWRQLIHFNEISPKWYKQNQSKFTLTQECKIVFH